MPERDHSGAIFASRHLPGKGNLTAAIKDCIDVAGYRTTLGSKAFAMAKPAASNADVVQALVDAEIAIAGKVVMHELAYGVTGINEWQGTPPNPHFPDRVPGGSSSGSAAAVAIEIVDFAIGTDTGGSIRVPATCCGIAGLKPTFGLVSRRGVYPATSSLDCVGPLARSVAMIEAAMAIIAPGFVAAPVPPKLRLGRVAGLADRAIEQAIDRALDQAGCEVTSLHLTDLTKAFRAGLTIMAWEMAELFGNLVGTGLLGSDVDQRLRRAMDTTPDDVAQAEQVRVAFTAAIDHAFDDVDAIVLPSLPVLPCLLTEAHDSIAALRMTELVRPFNLSGHPALSLPFLTMAGEPAGIQIIGPKRGDARICAIGRIIEDAIS